VIRPRGRRLVVKLPKAEQKTDSGLWIPGQAQEPPQEGIVMAKGEGCNGGFGVGDRVVFEQFAGLEQTDRDWGEVILLEEKDLMAVIGG
jgi:chaperonin GroES